VKSANFTAHNVICSNCLCA